jgi:hypothetical protein
VSGEVPGDPPNLVTFQIKFPRSEQSFKGYLASDEKNAIAGTFTRLDRTFGFYALREGANDSP